MVLTARRPQPVVQMGDAQLARTALLAYLVQLRVLVECTALLLDWLHLLGLVLLDTTALLVRCRHLLRQV